MVESSMLVHVAHMQMVVAIIILRMNVTVVLMLCL
jgi:hypothetical protein